MIDEKKLIEEIKEIESDQSCIGMDFEAFIDIVKEQPKVGEWIPASERLPNTNGVYNVTRKFAEGEYRFYVSDSAYFDGQDTWHADNRVNHGREYLKDIVAWSELPEPYKGGE